MHFNKHVGVKAPNMAKISAAYAICSIVQKCLSFLTMPLFTRLLTLEQYGQYSVYFSWSSIITILTTMNLQYGSFSRAMVKFSDSRNQYISVIQTICLLLSLVFLIIYLPLREYFNQFFELPTFLVVIMIIEIMANMAISSWAGRNRFEYKYKGVIFVTLLTSLLAPVIALILVLNVAEKGYARIIGYSIVTIVIGSCFFIYNYIRGKSPFRKDMWKYAFSMNAPLIFYYLSQVIFNQSDRIMISQMVGLDKAAIYSVAYNLAIVLNFVVDAINNSYVPWLYEKIRDGKESANGKISILIAILIAFLLLGIIALAPELVYILADAEYAEAKWIIPPIAMSVLLLLYSQFTINIQFYYEKNIFLVFASIGAALVNIGLNYWLIPIFGYYAAAYTTLASYLLFALGNYIFYLILLKKNKQKNKMYNVPILLLILFVFMGIGFLAMYLYNYSIVRYVIIGVVLLALLISSKFLIKFVRKLLAKEEGALETAELQNETDNKNEDLTGDDSNDIT